MTEKYTTDGLQGQLIAATVLLEALLHGWPPRHEPQEQCWRAIAPFAVDTEQLERDQSIAHATHRATAKLPVA